MLEFFDHVFEVGSQIEPCGFAALNQGVEYCVVGSGLEAAKEQIVFEPQLAGAYSILHSIVVNGQCAGLQVAFQLVPLPQSILDCFAAATRWALLIEIFFEEVFDFGDDWFGVSLTGSLYLIWWRVGVS